MKQSLVTFLVVPVLSTWISHAVEEPQADAADLPRIPATEPADALGKFEIKPGFRIELAAAEPDVIDPIAMCFDEAGALFVLEMIGYSERRDEELGRVRKLVDQDDDGVFETATVYVDKLKWPTALLCYRGGVFVGATPDILYCRDDDGDGVAEKRRTIFTGFGEGQPRLNMQALFNSLRWGPDNRVWGCTSRNGGKVRRPDQPESEALSLRGSDFSFDPEKLDLRAENGTGQYGMCFDSRNRRFTCSNSNHIVWIAYERNHTSTNPLFRLPTPLVSIADDGQAAPVFRISDDEPWRIVRTRWRVAGMVRGPVEGGGRVSGYFTSATGINLYWGDAFGDAYRDNAFIGDVGSNLVHRKLVVQKDGLSQPVATRPSDEMDTEFLRSSDNWFRPCSFANGPDGCLYIADMYRETIEHPWSLPEGIKKHLDLNSGNDRGRIWRIIPVDHQRRATPDLSKASDEALRALLDHENDWHRTTARRLLYERGHPATTPKPAPESFLANLGATEPDFSLLSPDQSDPWMEAAVLNALRTPAAFATAWNEHRDQGSPEFRRQLVAMIGRSKDKALIESVIASFAAMGPTRESADSLKALATSGVRIDGSKSLASLFDEARTRVSSPEVAQAERLAALDLLTMDRSKDSTQTIRTLVADREVGQEIRTAAIGALTNRSGSAGELIVEQWASFSASQKNRALEVVLGNPDSAVTILRAIGAGTIQRSEIPPTVADTLRASKAARVKSLANQIIPAPKIVPRSEVVAKYLPALELEGDAVKGRVAYEKACMACHRSPDGKGFDVGPALATFRTAGADSILSNIFDPNKEVAPQYQAYTFSLTNGEALVGMIESETTTDVTVKQIGGVVRSFPRKEVASMKGIGKSLMPEGLEATLTVEEVADLLAFITE